MNDVCTGCGEPNPPGTQFCLFCGIYLGWDESEAGPEAAPAAGPEIPPDLGADSTADTGPLPVDRTAPLPKVTAAPAGLADRPGARSAAPPRAPVAAAPVAAADVAAAGRACPNCGREADPHRRFCGHCGQVLATGAPARRPEAQRRGWWQRLLRSDTRLARRDYRRSLPPLYRWRRVGVTALIAALVVGGFAVVGHNPIGWATDRWYDVTNRLDPVRDVSVQALPEASVVGDNSPNGLLDVDPMSAWVTGWTPPEGRPACGESRGGRVVLSFPATRVRELRVITGVTDPSERPLQHIPTQLHIQVPDGSCQIVQLTRSPDVQEVSFDTGEPVGRLTISIGEAESGDDERVQDVAGLAQLTLLARPSRG